MSLTVTKYALSPLLLASSFFLCLPAIAQQLNRTGGNRPGSSCLCLKAVKEGAAASWQVTRQLVEDLSATQASEISKCATDGGIFMGGTSCIAVASLRGTKGINGKKGPSGADGTINWHFLTAGGGSSGIVDDGGGDNVGGGEGDGAGGDGGGGGGGGDPACFLAGTPITLADGSTVPIENVTLGALVISKGGEINRVLARKEALLGDQSIFVINGHIKVTGDHPFLALDGWRTIDGRNTMEFEEVAGLLEVGHLVLTPEGKEVLIKEIEEIKMPASTPIYNFYVSGSRTYTAGGLVVHNRK